MQQFEYTRFCLEREESQERDTRESKRKSRTDAVLSQTSTNNLVPRALSLEVESGIWEQGWSAATLFVVVSW